MKKKQLKTHSKALSQQGALAKTRSTAHKTCHQAFHLDEPLETTIAKQELFFMGENLQIERKAWNKNQTKWSEQNSMKNMLDSWEGEQIDTLAQPQKRNEMKINAQQKKEKEVINPQIQQSEKRRLYLKSAIEIRQNRKNLDSLKMSIRNSFAPLHSSILNVFPDPSSSNTTFSPQKDTSKLRKERRKIKSAYSSLRVSQEQKKRQALNKTFTTFEKGHVFRESCFPEFRTHEPRRMAGSWLKNKNSKKGKWIDVKNKFHNVERVYKIGNEKIRGEIGKIINLINEEDRIEDKLLMPQH